MSFLQSIVHRVTQKQANAISTLHHQKFTDKPKNIDRVWEALKEKFMGNLQQSVGEHANNISQYFSETKSQGLQVGTISERMMQRQMRCVEEVGKNMQNSSNFTLPIKAGETVQRPVRREEVRVESITQRKVQTKQKMTYQQPVIPVQEPARPIQPTSAQPKPLIQETSQRNRPQIKQIKFTPTSIKRSDKMPMFMNMASAVQNKQRQSSKIYKIISEHFQSHNSRSDFKSKLKQNFSSHLQSQMLQHGQKIHRHLLEQKQNKLNFNIGDLKKAILGKQQDHMRSFIQNWNNFDDFTLTIDKSVTFDRNIRNDTKKEQTTQKVVQEKPKQSIKQPIQSKPKKDLMGTVIKLQQKLPSHVHSSISQHLSKINQYLSEDDRQESPPSNQGSIQKSPMGSMASDFNGSYMNNLNYRQQSGKGGIKIQRPKMAMSTFVAKRDIVKQLEERKKKRDLQSRKARKLRANLIKLQPLAMKEQRQHKEKEARQKMNAAVDFVQNLDTSTRMKMKSFRVTQWRNDSLGKNIFTGPHKIIDSPNKYSNRKIQPLRGQQQRDMSDSQVSAMMRSGKKYIAAKEDKNFTLKKPMPYNIYNVNMKDQELFKIQYQ